MASENPPLYLMYEEICKSFHAIDDFRAKLLGLLPLASGTGIFLLLTDVLTDSTKREIAREYLTPVGIFGAVISLAFLIYEIRAISRCGALIEQGKKIECQLNVSGQFREFPPNSPGFVGADVAGKVIYSAVAASWIYLALMCADRFRESAPTIAIGAFVLIFIAAKSICWLAASQSKSRSGQLVPQATKSAKPLA